MKKRIGNSSIGRKSEWK